jgi:hypothetical protein
MLVLLYTQHIVAIDAIDTSSAAWRAQLFSRLLLLHPLLLPASNFVGG